MRISRIRPLRQAQGKQAHRKLAWILITAAVVLLGIGAVAALINADWFQSGEIGSPAETRSPNIETYRSDRFGFTFEYPVESRTRDHGASPAGFSVTEIPEGETLVILLRSVIPAEAGIQIAITPFDEDIVLTAERIKADIPDMVMQDARPARLGRAEGVGFNTPIPNSQFPITIELWAVWNGYLYQLKALQKDAALLEAVAESWRN